MLLAPLLSLKRSPPRCHGWAAGLFRGCAPMDDWTKQNFERAAKQITEALHWRLQQLRAKRDRGEVLTADERTEAVALAEQVFLSQRADRIRVLVSFGRAEQAESTPSAMESSR